MSNPSASKEKAHYPLVRGLARGLAVLEALNRCDSGCATPAQLGEMTGLHRTTVRRLLETLVAEGYVVRSPSHQTDTYLLSIRVRQLSDGFTDDEWVATLAPPILFELVRHVVWPSDLATPDGPGMLIRETTHRYSPLSFHGSIVGRRLPLLTTAAGRVYVAFCSEPQRAELLAMLRAGLGGEQQQRLAHDEAYIRNLVARVRERGYALNQGDMDDARKTGAIAVPVWQEERVVAAINIVYLERVVPADVAVARYLPHLQAAACTLAHRMTLAKRADPAAATDPGQIAASVAASPGHHDHAAAVAAAADPGFRAQSFMATDFSSV